VKLKKKFHISRKPVVPFTKGEQSHDLDNTSDVPRFDGPPRLVAIARDPWTIFAYWSVDWATIFKNVAPFDRKVHLRVHSGDGLEEKETTVEPMAGTHYVKLSQRHRSCHIEVGYYQPADAWHSVATSNKIVMLLGEISGFEDADIATIPFHLSFQQLVNLYGANQDALAIAISRFQKRVTSSGRYETLRSEDREILQKTGQTPAELTDSRRLFDQIDSEKLKRRAKALLGSEATSPSPGFGGDWNSLGS
jgi:Domain of unknown function (DUF4912)